MFRILDYILRKLFLIFLLFLAYATISDLFFYTYFYEFFIENLLNYVDYLKYIGIFSMAYLLISFFGFLEKIFKKKKNISSKTKNGKVEITLNTLNDISKKFLESKAIIKLANVQSSVRFSKVYLSASVETYSSENLNEKISNIQQELKENIILMTGIVVSNIEVKIIKIYPEQIIETEELKQEIFEKSQEDIVAETEEF